MTTGTQQAEAVPRERNRHHRPRFASDWFVGMIVYVRRKKTFERVDMCDGINYAHSSPLDRG